MAPAKNCDTQVMDRGARRREKSRDAARCRRQLESDTYSDINKVIPIPEKILSQMDRSSVMRLLISYMKLRNVVNYVPFKNPAIKQEATIDIPGDDEYVNALNGFVIVLSHDFDILYVSTNVKQYVGMSSLDLIGQNLFAYTHEGDHSELSRCMKTNPKKDMEDKSFFMRMKSTLTSSGRNVNLKSAMYKVLKCDGVMHCTSDPNNSFMVACCEPIPHPSNIEMILDSKTFLSQHSLDMKFTFCDNDRVCELLGYSEADMMEKSFFEFVHTADLKSLETSMKNLFRLGQITTARYRMLAKHGGYVWITSEVTIINNPRNQQPSYIVCVHYVLSGVMKSTEILSGAQLEFFTTRLPTMIKQEVELNEEILAQQFIQDCPDPTQVFCDNTNSILCDMGEDDSFVNFTDEALVHDTTSPTKLSESLAHNAPSIGDQIDFSLVDLADIFGEESCDDLYKNSPLEDPQWNPLPTIQEENIEDLFSDVNVSSSAETGDPTDTRTLADVVESETDFQAPLKKPNALEDLPVVPQRVAGTYRLVRLTKDQYDQHVENPPRKRHMNTKLENLLAQHNVPLKRQKIACLTDGYSAPSEPHIALQNMPDAEKLLLNGNKIDQERKVLASLFMKQGDECDSDFGKCGSALVNSSSCKGSDLSRFARPTEKPLLPVLSLHDCEVNAPITDYPTVDWMALSSALRI